MWKRLDKLWIGTLAGIIVPAMTLGIFSLVRYDHLHFSDFLAGYFKMGILTHAISLSVLPNLLVFFICIQANCLKAARGILMATILLALTVLIIRFA